jgi:hypothetical protein
MLGFSPTHAFVCKPGLSPFLHGWQEDVYAFSWIRDRFLDPCRTFLAKTTLTQAMLYRLVDDLADRTGSEMRHLIKNALATLSPGITPRQFKEQAIGLLKEQQWVKKVDLLPFTASDIDSLLYNSIPLFDPKMLDRYLTMIFDRIPGMESFGSQAGKLLNRMDRYPFSNRYVLTAADLREIAKAMVILISGQVYHSRDLHAEISLAMQKLELSMPQPLIFADSNWVRDYFGFIVNPGTEEIELWRMDYAGASAIPIPDWRKWLDGTQKKPWGLYTKPFEYGQ